MEEATRIKQRISSLHELRNIVHAIRGMAAARIQEAQSALEGIRNYVAIVEDALAEAAGLAPDVAERSVRTQTAPSSVLILVCAEHGFVGGYNDTLLDQVGGLIKPGQRLGIIGRRGAAAGGERGLGPAWQVPGTAYVKGVAGVARRVAETVVDCSHAEIVFARFQGGAGYRTEVKTILPLDPALLEGAGQRMAPIHQLAPDRLLDALAREYLFAELTRAVMEGLASENGARLSTMQAADHNIGDKLETLEKQERVVRQEAITVELLDVVTGAQAMDPNGFGR